MNSKVKITLWGVSRDATPEQAQQLKTLGAPLTVLVGGNKVSSELIDAHLIVAHDGLPNSFSKRSDAWLIYTGGSKADVPPKEKNQPGNISWNTFEENIRNFHSLVKDKSEITEEDLGILYAIDPKLERLLESFANANPFEVSGKVVGDLKKAKVELQAYVENLIQKQSKSR